MSKPWKTDADLFQLAKKELFVAVVGDVMDRLKLFHQFLPPRIAPIRNDMVTIGRAMTVLEADVFEAEGSPSKNSTSSRAFGLLFDALDDLKPDEVYVCTGASPRYALWGELMTTRAMVLKAAGAVLDGYTRDVLEIMRMNFPLFAYGSFAQDQGPRGKVIDYRVTVEIDSVRIRPGDILFGDADGICVVPAEAEEEVFRLALEKARGEKTVKEAIENGMPAKKAFEEFGIM